MIISKTDLIKCHENPAFADDSDVKYKADRFENVSYYILIIFPIKQDE